VQTHAVLCANTSLVPGHFLEDKAVLELRPLIQDYVHVKVTVSNVPVPQDEGFCLITQVIEETRPLSDIEGDVIRQDLPLLAHCRHGYVLPDLPYLAVLLVVIGDDSVIKILHLFKQLIKILSRGLHEEHVFIVLHFIEYARMKMSHDCMVCVSIYIL
jgi:hypothetical protein